MDYAPLLLLLAGATLSIYWVATAGKTEVQPGQTVIEFLWPTYTPQKVRYGEYLKEKYERQNPNIHVNLIKTGDPYRKLQIMIAGRTTPDVAWMGVGWNQFADAFLPLDEYVQDDSGMAPDNFFPGLWDSCEWNDSLRAFPSSAQVGVIYYNKDLFDDAGLPYPTQDWTWDDMVRVSKALTHDFDGDGTIDQYGLQLEQVYRLPFMMYAGQIANPTWTEAELDKPLIVDILGRYRDLIYTDRVMPTPQASAELGMLPMFEAGRVAMHAASGYALESFRKVQFDWDVITFPWYEFEDKQYRATGLWQEEFVVLWNTEQETEAVEFARWCASEELIGWAAEEGHIVPGRIDVARSPLFNDPSKRPEHMGVFIDSQAFAVPVLSHPDYKRVSLDFDPIWQQFMEGSEGVRISAEEAAGQMQTALQQILDDYNEEHEIISAVNTTEPQVKEMNEQPEFVVKKTSTPPSLKGDWDGEVWQQANVLEITNWHAEGSDHRPKTQAKALYDDKNIYIMFKVEDQYVRAIETKYCGKVWEDACVEFFVQPKPDRGYFNFEINCGGTMLSSYHETVGETTRLTIEEARQIVIHHSMPETVEPEHEEPVTWYIEYALPLEVLENHVGEFGNLADGQWRANFYKCAENNSHPHWGTWAPITGELNFHRPQFFAPLKFE